MQQSLLYFIAAILFLIAAGLSTVNDGLTLKTGLGIVLAGVMIALGLRMRKAGQ